MGSLNREGEERAASPGDCQIASLGSINPALRRAPTADTAADFCVLPFARGVSLPDSTVSFNGNQRPRLGDGLPGKVPCLLKGARSLLTASLLLA
jgi:hypothetical protein